MSRIIILLTTPLLDTALSVGLSGPKSVVKKVIFHGASLVYFLGSNSAHESKAMSCYSSVPMPLI